MDLVLAGEALRILRRRLHVLRRGLPAYPGTAEEVVSQILDACWNREEGFYMVSSGHFRQFYVRDFAWVVRALIALGHKEEVRKTLSYALERFSRAGRITTTITPKGRPFDFPIYAPDSLGYLLYSLSELGDSALVAQHRDLLDKEIAYFAENVIEEDTGLVRTDRHFSSMKDYAKRKGASYDLCMAYLVQRHGKALGLATPLAAYDFRKLIMEHYFHPDGYFLDDRSGATHIAGDAQVTPFWTGLVTDRAVFDRVRTALDREGLNYPLALRYTARRKVDHAMIMVELVNMDYERDVLWAHLGMMWIEVLLGYDKALLDEEMAKYEAVITRYRNFLEVYYPDMSPFRGPFYIADDSMIWSAVWLAVKKGKLSPRAA